MHCINYLEQKLYKTKREAVKPLPCDRLENELLFRFEDTSPNHLSG